MDSLPEDTRSSGGNIVHESDTCMSLAMDDNTRASQVNLQASTTGSISYMNCVGVGISFLTFNFKVNKHFLTRHNLRIGQMYTINSPSREILAEAIQEFGSQIKDIPLIPGGAGMDIARIAQWLLPQPKTVAFVGARASDVDALRVKELCKPTRVAVRMEEMANRRTAVLLVAHYKRKWCEIFFIDNMATINTSFIDKPFVTKMLERANIVFITEISVLMNPRVTQKLAYYSFSRFKHCLLFLHREQFLNDIKESIQEILNYVDIIFLTPRCCKRWRHAWDIYLWLKDVAKKSSIVIVSDGLNTAYVHTGFMAMMIRGHQLDPCVECGFYCASVIVRRFGVQIPDDEAVLSEWYLLLDHILQRKIGEQPLKKRESNLPFTMFQTPWKEREVNEILGTSFNSAKVPKDFTPGQPDNRTKEKRSHKSPA